MRNTIAEKARNNVYSIYHDYLVPNKDLCSPKYYNDSNFPEHDRNILTKYRTGSHYLAIQTGRHTGIPRNERLCKCKKLQTLQHIILECELTKKIRNENYPKDLQTFFSTDPSKMAEYIRHIEYELKLR